MADGWQMIIDALNNYADKSGWTERNKLTSIDWGATLKKLFGKKSGPAIDETLQYTPNPNVPQNTSSTLSSATDVSATSPENATASWQNTPYAKYLENKGIIQYKAKPEFYEAVDQWNQEQQDLRKAQQAKDLAILLQQAQLDRLNAKPETPTYDPAEYITIDQNTLSQIPSSYRGLYQIGQPVKRSEITALITAANKPKTTNESNIDLNRQYQGVLDAYAQYQNNVKNRRGFEGITPATTPLSLENWLRQPGREGQLAIYNRFMGTNLKSLPEPYSTGKTKRSSNPIDQYISQHGGIGRAMVALWEKIPQKEMQALLDKYNRHHETNYTLKQFRDRFIKR